MFGFMKRRGGARFGLLSALVATGLVASATASITAVASNASGDTLSAAASCKNTKISGKRVKLCKGDRGPRGKQGAQGPQGPQGPAGATGAPGQAGAPGRGIVFDRSMPNNTSSVVVFEQNGLKFEASCINHIVSFSVTPQGADHNIVQNTVSDNLNQTVGFYDNLDANANAQVDLLDGGSGAADYQGLLTVRTRQGSSQLNFVQWWASGANNSAQGGACFVGGTVSY